VNLAANRKDIRASGVNVRGRCIGASAPLAKEPALCDGPQKRQLVTPIMMQPRSLHRKFLRQPVGQCPQRRRRNAPSAPGHPNDARRVSAVSQPGKRWKTQNGPCCFSRESDSPETKGAAIQNYLETYLWHLNIWIRQPCDEADLKWLRDERERIRKALMLPDSSIAR
jgi:hypothetical protein